MHQGIVIQADANASVERELPRRVTAHRNEFNPHIGVLAVAIDIIELHAGSTAGITLNNHPIPRRIIIAVKGDVHHQGAAVAAVVTFYRQGFELRRSVTDKVNGGAVQRQAGYGGATGHIPQAVAPVQRQIDGAVIDGGDGAVQVRVIRSA